MFLIKLAFDEARIKDIAQPRCVVRRVPIGQTFAPVRSCPTVHNAVDCTVPVAGMTLKRRKHRDAPSDKADKTTGFNVVLDAPSDDEEVEERTSDEVLDTTKKKRKVRLPALATVVRALL